MLPASKIKKINFIYQAQQNQLDAQTLNKSNILGTKVTTDTHKNKIKESKNNLVSNIKIIHIIQTVMMKNLNKRVNAYLPKHFFWKGALQFHVKPQHIIVCKPWKKNLSCIQLIQTTAHRPNIQWMIILQAKYCKETFKSPTVGNHELLKMIEVVTSNRILHNE